MYLLFTSETVFVARQHLVPQKCYLKFFSLPELYSIKLAENSLSSCGDADARLTGLDFSITDSSPFLLICPLWRMTFSCSVCICVLVHVLYINIQSLFYRTETDFTLLWRNYILYIQSYVNIQTQVLVLSENVVTAFVGGYSFLYLLPFVLVNKVCMIYVEPVEDKNRPVRCSNKALLTFMLCACW